MRQFPLITRLSIAMSALALMALASIFSALWLAEQIEGDAAAVNKAGTLRMTAYRILATERTPAEQHTNDATTADAAAPWRADFNRRLNSPELRAAVPAASDHPVKQAMTAVEQAWADSPLSGRPGSSNADADRLVDTIDRLVTVLEQNSNRKLAALRLVEHGFAAVAVVIIVLIGVWVWRRLARPLKALTGQADRLRAHDWSARTHLHGADELATLSDSLNNMAAEQARSYADLQLQIEERTQSLLQEQARLAVLNERSSIARELHDSLAQSLTYQKIQLSLLKNQLDQTPDSGTAWQPIVNQLHTSVNDAYRQLRELLVTFRLQMTHGNLDAAILDTVQKLTETPPDKNRSPLAISVHGKFAGLPLTAEMEVHILHILREALSNVNRHANATQAWVNISVQENQVVMTIEDNGDGLPDNADKPLHFGLQILRERAEQLNGRLSMATTGAGTRATLTFSVSRGPET